MILILRNILTILLYAKYLINYFIKYTNIIKITEI